MNTKSKQSLSFDVSYKFIIFFQRWHYYGWSFYTKSVVTYIFDTDIKCNVRKGFHSNDFYDETLMYRTADGVADI